MRRRSCAAAVPPELGVGAQPARVSAACARLVRNGGHACACTLESEMRTTIEIPDDIRARLLETAARRGEKGFSRIVEEALVRYLDAEADREATVGAALAVLGSLSDDEAEQMRREIDVVRARWR